ncbi:methionine synthase [Nocardiopsis composta]|uniref:Methionine synthase II (Cobalamin-independent) n=1 Tax=Nocardiopsis composta TaxID=157465 RepID=A0A7W8QNA8_9ACTN|nr:methionine synthase [Nocardiopsis composta]MBB5432591.1 methionine synthase II (cobalamin-independent) [Nocardiopsis composta]
MASWTGVGSYPWEDPDEAARTVFGELTQLPHLPELPARGAGADIIGRTAALLVDIPVEVQPTGWRVARGPGRDLARAGSFLSYDLEAVERHGADYTGPFKVQAAGPWTLAASVELRSGERMLGDRGAVADLAASLAEGLRAHIADVAARLPGAELIVQIDEPSLPAVLAGRVPTASGYRRIPAPDPVVARERLGGVFAAIAGAGALPAAHCCAEDVPIGLLRRSGARVLGLDATLLTPGSDEALGEAVEDGAGLFLGVAARARAGVSDPVGTVDPVRELWNRIGFAPESLAGTVVLTPVCGLAGTSPEGARAALDACREAARVLRDDPRG